MLGEVPQDILERMRLPKMNGDGLREHRIREPAPRDQMREHLRPVGYGCAPSQEIAPRNQAQGRAANMRRDGGAGWHLSNFGGWTAVSRFIDMIGVVE